MDKSFMATLYIIAIAVFFLVLVIMTIMMIVGKIKHRDDDLFDEGEDEDEDDPDDMSEFYDKYEPVNDSVASTVQYTENVSSDIASTVNNNLKENEGVLETIETIPEIPINVTDDTYVNTYDPQQDSAFTDSAFTDSAFTDSAFTDSAFTDSAFTDSAFTDSAFTDSAFADSAFSQEEAPAQEEVPAQEKVPAQEETLAQEEVPTAKNVDSAFADSAFADSAFADSAFADSASDTAEAVAESADMTAATAAITASGMMSDAIQVTVSDASQVIVSPKKMKKNGKKDFAQEFKPMAPSAPVDRFYWYNKTDVAAKPSYKTEEMYYHYFETPKECIEDLLVEMYDCALVRTEEIRYIAYGIAPRAISMREILSSKEGTNTQIKKKEPSTQDLIKIYENWCGYVEKLFGIIEFHADTYTIDEIHTLLCEFGKSDVDILITGM